MNTLKKVSVSENGGDGYYLIFYNDMFVDQGDDYHDKQPERFDGMFAFAEHIKMAVEKVCVEIDYICDDRAADGNGKDALKYYIDISDLQSEEGQTYDKYIAKMVKLFNKKHASHTIKQD